MTIDQFVEQLAQHPGPWRCEVNGEIRARATETEETCPICAVAGLTNALNYAFWADVLGLSIADAHAIVLAADNDVMAFGFKRDLRARLLAATRLSS